MAVATVVPIRPALTDARPMLPRNETNLWTRAEGLRDHLYEQIAEICEKLQLEPLLLKSEPNVSPAWVKFEAWKPRQTAATTERSAALLTIEPKPYHAHPFEIELTFSAENTTRRLHRLMPPSQAETEALMEHLVNAKSKPRFRQFREKPWQLWREKNELVGLRMDVIAVIAGLCVIMGFALLVVHVLLALVIWAGAVYAGLRIGKRRWMVRNEGKPRTEPRSLIRVDSWQTVLFDLGGDAEAVRARLLRSLEAGLDERRRFHTEQVWYWGLDGKEEREQWVLTSGRGIVFCQVYRYGRDLYLAWDGHLNRGQWVEQTVASGIDAATGNPITITRVVPGTQPTSEYDLSELSCLMEWTHAQIVKLLKQIIAERKIDQEIDFKIQRAERQQVVASGAAVASDGGGVTNKVRQLFQRLG